MSPTVAAGPVRCAVNDVPVVDALTISTARERRLGFVDAMSNAGLPDDLDQHADNLTSAELAYDAVHRLMQLDNPPTALFSSQNLVTTGVIRALHALGRQDQLALVGFDDLLMADLLSPAITVMAQDPVAIGTIAARRLFARLDGDRSPEQTIIVPAHLIERGSGEIRPPSS